MIFFKARNILQIESQQLPKSRYNLHGACYNRSQHFTPPKISIACLIVQHLERFTPQ
jgi:hypothetical protein